jgi:predicted nucleic acid-binding protein
MSGFVVADSSTLFAVLADDSPHAHWAAAQLHNHSLAAPHLAIFETANIIRRYVAAGLLDPTAASESHRTLLRIKCSLWPYSVIAERVWELRHEVTVYDASYIAVAEMINAPFITLDRRVKRANGPRCEILTPPQL